MDFCGHECNILYKALRYYQINKTVTGSKEYWDCDTILTKLEPYKQIGGVEPGFRHEE